MLKSSKHLARSCVAEICVCPFYWPFLYTPVGACGFECFYGLLYYFFSAKIMPPKILPLNKLSHWPLKRGFTVCIWSTYKIVSLRVSFTPFGAHLPILKDIFNFAKYFVKGITNAIPQALT